MGPSDLNDPANTEKAEIFQATLNPVTQLMENQVRLTFDDKYCYDPAWSPDGQWIAYSKGAFINLFLHKTMIFINVNRMAQRMYWFCMMEK